MAWQSCFVGVLIAMGMLGCLFWECRCVEDLLGVCFVGVYVGLVGVGAVWEGVGLAF